MNARCATTNSSRIGRIYSTAPAANALFNGVPALV